MEITIAGQLFETEISADTNQSNEFEWDGLDAYGREVRGTQEAKVRIGYVYSGVYNSTSRFATSEGAEITGSQTRQEVSLWQTYTTEIGVFNQNKAGLGGWSLSPQHLYDVNEKVIYFGNGEKRSAGSVATTIKTVAGTGSRGYSGDGGEATSAAIDYPGSIVADEEGNLFIPDHNHNVVRKVDTSGIITSIAGTGSSGYSGDGGLATSATLYYPVGLSVDGKGDLFIADYKNHVIRKVDTAGIITTVAGTGSRGYSGDGGLATSATLYYPYKVAVDREGNLFIAEYGNNVIRKVDTAGIITTVVGTGSSGYSGDGGLATSATLSSPHGIAVDREGNLFIADYGNHVIRKIDTSGIITTIAGTGSDGYSGEGGFARRAERYS